MKKIKKTLFILFFGLFIVSISSSVFADKRNGMHPDLREDTTETTTHQKGTYDWAAERNERDKQKPQTTQKKESDKKNEKTTETTCKGIKLNTDVPFIGNCIETTNKENATTQLNAFPRLMGAMMKLIMMTILIMSFLMIVAGGVLLTMKGSVKQVEDGMALIQKVAIGMALLGASGVILKLINPNFFV